MIARGKEMSGEVKRKRGSLPREPVKNKFGYFVPDLHQLLRSELLQHRIADERDERDLLAETSCQVEIETQTTR